MNKLMLTSLVLLTTLLSLTASAIVPPAETEQQTQEYFERINSELPQRITGFGMTKSKIFSKGKEIHTTFIMAGDDDPESQGVPAEDFLVMTKDATRADSCYSSEYHDYLGNGFHVFLHYLSIDGKPLRTIKITAETCEEDLKPVAPITTTIAMAKLKLDAVPTAEELKDARHAFKLFNKELPIQIDVVTTLTKMQVTGTEIHGTIVVNASSDWKLDDGSGVIDTELQDTIFKRVIKNVCTNILTMVYPRQGFTLLYRYVSSDGYLLNTITIDAKACMVFHKTRRIP